MGDLSQLLTAIGVLLAPILTAVVALVAGNRKTAAASEGPPTHDGPGAKTDRAFAVILDELVETREDLARCAARVAVLEGLLTDHHIEVPPA